MSKDYLMIKKIILVSIVSMVSFTSITAKTTQINYKAKFGIFGTVGTIKNKLIQNKKTYRIDTIVKLAGLAKMIMGGQTEHYISKGHMEKGKMVSDLYQMISKKKHKTVSKEYRIDHKHKFVTKRYRKWKDGKLVKEKTEKLKFYAKDDLLTLYFNMDKAITQKGKVYTIKAVGLEKQKGIVTVTVPTDAKATSYKKDLGKSADWYAKALIVQKNFKKKKGDILLSVDKDRFIKKAVIKDVLLYGDAKLIRTK
jgi:hypothetical protein